MIREMFFKLEQNVCILKSLPTIFDRADSDDGIDYEALGISSVNDSYVEDTVFDITRMQGYTKTKYKDKSVTLMWLDGFRFWINLSVEDFEKEVVVCLERNGRV